LKLGTWHCTCQVTKVSLNIDEEMCVAKLTGRRHSTV